MLRRRKRPAPRQPKRIAAHPTPPLPVTVLGVTYTPKAKDAERYTPEAKQVRLH